MLRNREQPVRAIVGECSQAVSKTLSRLALNLLHTICLLELQVIEKSFGCIFDADLWHSFASTRQARAEHASRASH